MAHKITKDIEKKIAGLAKQIPTTTYGIKKHVYKRLNDKVVERTTVGENLFKVNHKNRMKQAFKDNGLQGLKDYIDGIGELVNSKLDIAVNL